MLMISEIKDFPDFSLFLEMMQNKKIDNEVKTVTYISLVSKFFVPDSNPNIGQIMTKRDSNKTQNFNIIY